jgi:signal transduction histidine kinase
LPEGSTWTKVDGNGTILVRYPAPEQSVVGEPLAEKSLLQAFLTRKNGVTEEVDSNGVAIFYDFTSTRSVLVADDVISILSIPRNVLFAEPDRMVSRNLASVGIVAGLILAIGWIGARYLVLRPIQALIDFTARLGAGDHSARAGIGLPRARNELRQLMHAFDHMAEALQQRDKERQEADGKLIQSRQRLQALSRRLVDVQETERRHLARELHDEIGQALTAMQMNLQALLKAPGAAPLAPRLSESLAVVERVLEQVHDIALNLRPSMLDDLGLEPALRWYTDRQASLTGLHAEVRLEPMQQRLDPMIETECFRVAQEAVTNVVKHAKAHDVTVELSQNREQLHLSVRDDGVGFDVASFRERAVRGASLGLLSMEERATLAGGGLQYHSTPGQGTEVHAWFPLRWAIHPVPMGAT